MEGLSQLPLSHSVAQPQQALVDAQGNGCKISLQAVELEGRPKLVRTLRNAGALVMSNTKEADIILVDSSTESGRRLIRMWGHDPSKVVLEHSWLQKCIEAGRPLLEEDAWGDALTVDDGQPVEIDALEEMRRDTSQTELRQNQSPSNQSFQYAQSTSFVQAPQIPLQHAQNSYLYHSFPARSAAQFSFPPSQSHMMTMRSTMGPNLQSYNLQSQNPMSAYETLLDVVRHSAGQPSWSSQNTPISYNSLASDRGAQSDCDYADADMSRPVADSPNYSRDHTIRVKRHSSAEDLDSRPLRVHTTHRRHALRPPSARVHAPSISRKNLPAVKQARPLKRSRKGKERTVSTESSENSAHESPSSTPSSPATSSLRPLNIVAGKRRGEVFLSDAGLPLNFFVQVDLHGRHNVVSNIKKNKGKIVNNIPDADYVILYSRSKSAFDGLLSEATAVGKLPIQAAFVIDCIEECALLDEEDYALEPSSKGRLLKRGRQNAPTNLVETPEIIKRKAKTKQLDNEAKRLSATPPNRPVDETMKTPPVHTELPPFRNTKSPLPPPAEARQMMKNGKFYFTEVEDEFLLRYAKYRLEQDPSMSHTALMHRVHAKMPHHTVASWMGHVDQRLRRSLDDIRKRAKIAKRMYPPDKAGPSGRISVESEPEPPKKQRLISRAMDGNRLDFEVITQFFAGGGGDDDNDERVWQELEKYRPCQTANSWPEYYAAHEKNVYARIEELMSEHASRSQAV
ncbi:hypothetical protein F5I97DRAFT_1814450 [Phlebopus sp. FC_14]|nr:hypothetical protein F5I97DRAFT_1814450 [Phlebopus sp. FC_14]